MPIQERTVRVILRLAEVTSRRDCLALLRHLVDREQGDVAHYCNSQTALLSGISTCDRA